MKRIDLINKLLCFIGWHSFKFSIQDCIEEFGYIPNDARIPKKAKCSSCGKQYKK